MTSKEKISRVKELTKHYKNMEVLSEKIENIFGTCDGKLYDVMYDMFDAYTDNVSNAIGDDFEYLHWFIFENECGRRGLTCSFQKKFYKIKTETDLVNFIELTSKK